MELIDPQSIAEEDDMDALLEDFVDVPLRDPLTLLHESKTQKEFATRRCGWSLCDRSEPITRLVEAIGSSGSSQGW